MKGMNMANDKKEAEHLTAGGTSRREALETLAGVAKYIAPATLVLVSSVSAAGSVQ
jgi:hypothetical protein